MLLFSAEEVQETQNYAFQSFTQIIGAGRAKQVLILNHMLFEMYVTNLFK